MPNEPWKGTPGPASGCLCTSRTACCRLAEALQEFGAAEHLRSQLTGSHVLANQVTGWRLAIQARLGMTGQARAELAALDDEQAGAGEIGNARAAVCLADGDPAGALGALR